jgi:hypothetical protein
MNVEESKITNGAVSEDLNGKIQAVNKVSYH